MPTIAFSQNFIQSSLTSNNVFGRMMNYTSNAGTGFLTKGWADQYSSNPAGNLLIMKGTMPETLTSTNISSPDRRGDILCSFVMSGSQNGAPTTNHFSASASTYYLNPAVITTTFATVGANGTATWFWWVQRQWAAAVGLSNTLYYQIAGSIGEVGSGADLEMSSTNVTSGQQLRVYNLRLQLPTSWTF